MSANSMSPAIAAFRALHDSGCFVMPNPWDIGSTKILSRLGFKALATTSAGYAFTRGLPDTVSALSLDDVLIHFQEIAGATPLPVNGDFQHGYAASPDDILRNVSLAVKTGIAGISIEDASGDRQRPLYERSLAIERVRAARAAIDQSGTDVLLTARCEAYLLALPDCDKLARDRLSAFAEAGADCLYAPAVRDPTAISQIVRLVAPRAVNVLVSSPGPGMSLAELRALGVRRISVGSALAKFAWAATLRAASEMAESGTFESLAANKAFGLLEDYL